MKKIIYFLALMLVMIPVKALDDLAPNSKSAILIEEKTGTILFEKNVHEKLAPASMTKLMSMLIIMEEIDNNRIKPNDLVLISNNASKMGGSQMFLEEGTSVRVEELLKGISIASGNDAVVAMSEKISGSESAFVDLMNKRVKDLDLKNTVFKNSHGLDVEGHYSSAYDMAMIAKELLKHPKILEYTSIYETYFNKPDGSRTWLVNTNRLVRFYEGIDGLKTGFTSNAQYCLTATGIKNNIRMISVVMGVSTSELRSKDTTNLLGYGFNGYKLNNIVTKDDDLGNIYIENGIKEYAKLMVIENEIELLKNTDESKKYKYTINNYKVKAPIKVGEIVGTLSIYDQEQKIKTINLTIKENVDKANFFIILKRNLNKILNNLKI